MASQLALKLRHEMEKYLSRDLTSRELRKCEEIAINFKPWVPFKYLEGLRQALSRHSARNRNFGMLYYSLLAMAASFRGITRRHDLVSIRGRLRYVYDQCCTLAGHGFNEKDLASILFLASDCTNQEIYAAFEIARLYGYRKLRFLRGVILKNRAVVLVQVPESVKGDPDKIKTQLTHWANSRYPEVKMLQGLYKTRVVNALGRHKKLRFMWDALNGSEESEYGTLDA